MLTPVPKNSGKAWGTLKGKGQYVSTSTAWDSATDGTYSIRKTTNKNSATSNGYVSACNKSYLMVTGWLKVTGGTTLKTVQIKVTASQFATTLEENLPTRPAAATDPVAAPASAVQLASSAIAAAITALYLF